MNPRASLEEGSSPPQRPGTLPLYQLTPFFEGKSFKCHKYYFTEYILKYLLKQNICLSMEVILVFWCHKHGIAFLGLYVFVNLLKISLHIVNSAGGSDVQASP